MRRVLIFANPLSGRGRGIALLTSILPAIVERGLDVEACVEHAAQFDVMSDDATKLHSVIVIGGDGTLRSVVERLGHLLGYDNIPPILFIGLGTANLMQRHLQLSYPRDEALAPYVADLVERRRTTRIDVGEANGRLFLLMASCGFDAAVVHALAEVRTGPITLMSYVAPALAALRDADFIPVTVEIDETPVLRSQPALVFVGNVAEYGTGFPVLTLADSRDGLLDVCIIPCGSRSWVALTAAMTTIGQHGRLPGAIYTNGKHVRITSDRPLPMQVDGDAAGHTPADIRLLDQQVTFIVP